MSHSSEVRKSHRLWFLGSVVFLAIIALVVTWSRPELELMFKVWVAFGVALLSLLLMLLWLLLLSRFSWKTRLATVLLLALAGFGVYRTLRIDGTIDGSGLPRLVWKHSSPREAAPELRTKLAPEHVPPATLTTSDIPDVPQFFGESRDGRAGRVKLVTDWSASPPKELWRQPIGSGWSSFAVAKGRAYTQEQRGEIELVTCYDLLSGELIWAHTNQVRFFQWQAGEGPRATPTVTASNVYSYGATGLLDCLNAASGETVWSRDVLAEHRLPNLVWGVSCSPLVYGNTVLVTGGLTNGPTLIAYERETGKPLWTSGSDKASYASPILARVAGQDVILSVNAASFTVHDPATGKERLNYPWGSDGFPKASQPIVLDENHVFISAGYGVGCALLEIKAVSPTTLTVHALWRNQMMKTQFNSAANRQGYIYGLDDGLLACIEIATGKRHWKDGRYGSGQTLLAGDFILVQSEPGAVALVEANPDQFKEVARWPALSSKTWNYPTLAGRYLLVRNDREAVCYELPIQPPLDAVGAH